MSNRIRILSFLAVALVLGSYFIPYSYSKGVSQFTLYGNVIDGSTCNPIVGALVTAPYNENTSNLTNSTGGYLLRLGYGNWTVTVSKGNYTPISFNTPYVSSGSYQFNTYLLMPGTFASNCTAGRHAENSTVPTTVTAESTISSNPTTSVLNNTNRNGYQQASIGSGAEIAAGIVIVVIILVVLAYFALKGRGSAEGKKEQKEEQKKA
jgi:hypothetical protein